MRSLLGQARLILTAAGLLAAVSAYAQPRYPTEQGNTTAPGQLDMCMNAAGKAVPCALSDTAPTVKRPFRSAQPEDRGVVVLISPNSGAAGQYPSGSIPITGNATGSTSAVVGTLAGVANRLTWICGFNVSAIGGTAAVGPITIAGLTGSSMVYQLASTASGNLVSQTFTPCIPASAINTAITITTTADGTATGVDVNSWGFQQ